MTESAPDRMKRGAVLLVVLAVLVGCARTRYVDGATSRPPSTCTESVVGSPDALKTPVAPAFCDVSGGGRGATIRVHGHGARKLSSRRDAPFANGPCASVDADPATCPEVPIDAFDRALVGRATGSATIHGAQSFGKGGCGAVTNDVHDWVSLVVYDWADADAAIAVVAAELERWNLGDFYTVSVSWVPCRVPG